MAVAAAVKNTLRPLFFMLFAQRFKNERPVGNRYSSSGSVHFHTLYRFHRLIYNRKGNEKKTLAVRSLARDRAE